MKAGEAADKQTPSRKPRQHSMEDHLHKQEAQLNSNMRADKNNRHGRDGAKTMREEETLLNSSEEIIHLSGVRKQVTVLFDA